MQNQLEQLKTMTTVVADTGDFNSIAQYSPEDATTNPSLLLKAAAMPEMASLVTQAVDYAKAQNIPASEKAGEAADYLSVLIGQQLLTMVPGRVSTEVDARLSFDTEKTVAKARKLIGLYETLGVDKSRILIKIASTWEGIKAAEIIEKEGIQCNLTLLFSFAQARACAEAEVFLISPFVGRILDWHKKNQGVDSIPVEQDPGVISVTEIYNYYKQHGYNTVVMGASFRNTDEILFLAGCDRLTISPALLESLANETATVERKLAAPSSVSDKPSRITEAEFRWSYNEDAMATEKTAEGIRMFAKDQNTLEVMLAERISQ